MIGGAHQFAHLLPVACEIELAHPGQVTVFVTTRTEASDVQAFARSIGRPAPEVVVLQLPAALKALLPRKAHKLAALLTWTRRLCKADAILCAERTSTILARLGLSCPPILHIPHGAGDRAVGFEKRFALFDHVFVAGRKDRDRLVASGHVAADACTVAGPIKLAAMLRSAEGRPPLFANDRPTVLYNPHFSARHSSMDAFGKRLVEAVVRDGRYNLVVAPHLRLAQHWSGRRRAEWAAMARPGQVIVDLGTSRSNDMTYTLGADIYVGDVSSQVYEFLVRPRPCLFVNAHGADWRDSEDYAMWHFGEVITPEADPIAAIDRAVTDKSAYVAWQKERMAYAIDGIGWLPDGTPSFSGPDPVAETARQVARIAGLDAPQAAAA